MIEVTEEIQKLWDQETGRIQEGHTMLSWEACQMIAWNKVVEMLDLKDKEEI